MDADVAVEPATTGDLDALLALWTALVESQRGFGSHLTVEGNQSPARDVLAQHVAGDRVLVARSTATSGEPDAPAGILGFVSFYVETGLYEQTDTRGVVENLYVIPAAREQGIGSALLAAAETRLAERGAEVVALSVLAQNQAARAFYRNRDYDEHRITFERTPDDEED
jgi:ribosomal protein S18 acetylase RimI-like enzyme